jgi:hypothetical protein
VTSGTENLEPRTSLSWNLETGSLDPPVLLECDEDLLGVWIDELGPGLPEGVHDVVDESHLGLLDRRVVTIAHRRDVDARLTFLQIRDGIFKLLRSPRIDSKESIPAAYIARRACTTTLFLLGSQTHRLL